MCKYFSYNGINTNTILEQPLMLVSFDRESEYEVFSKELLKTEKSVKNYKSKTYASKFTDDLTFDIVLIKQDFKRFTKEEFRKISSSLLSVDEDMKLEFHSDDEVINTYFLGQFTSITETVADGIAAISCTFENNSQFSYEDKTYSTTCATEKILVYECDSDIKNGFIYPKLTLVANESGTITIQNMSDTVEINSMNITLNKNVKTIIDCDNCIIYDSLGTIIDYEDLGFTDVTSLYWLRFLSGNNSLKLVGNFNMTIDTVLPREEGVPTCY